MGEEAGKKRLKVKSGPGDRFWTAIEKAGDGERKRGKKRFMEALSRHRETSDCLSVCGDP